jgi:nicotinamidase-related amidase
MTEEKVAKIEMKLKVYPVKKVLVIVDMQKDFVDGVLGTPEAQAIVPNINKKICEYEERQDDIIFTMDTHRKGSYLDSQEGKKLPVEHCIIGTDGWNLYEGIKYEHIYKMFCKPTFGSIQLAEFIRDNYLNVEVEFCGVCTSICVINNVSLVKAFNPEARIVVDSKCCADVTPEMNKKALDVMKSFQVEVI